MTKHFWFIINCNHPLMNEQQITEQSDVISQFLSSRCEVGSEWKEGKTAFFEELKAWCCANGSLTPSILAVSEQMKARGFTEYRDKSKRFWQGLRLRQEAMDFPVSVNNSETVFEISPPCVEPLSINSMESARAPVNPFEEMSCHFLLRKHMGIV